MVKAEHWQQPGYRMQEKEQQMRQMLMQSLKYMMQPPQE